MNSQRIDAAFAKFNLILNEMPEKTTDGDLYDFWSEELRQAELALIQEIERPRLEFASAYFGVHVGVVLVARKEK
jgi:hypothetical protein